MSWPLFKDNAGFLLKTAPHPLFYPNCWGVLLGLDCRFWAPRSKGSKLINRAITFKLTQRHGQTDRQTGGRLTVAIRSAWRGNKNVLHATDV